MSAFFAGLEPEIARAALRAREHGLSPADLRQQLGALLFAPRGASGPKIADYEGRAPLRTWVRVVLARLVVDFARTRSGREPVVHGQEAVCRLQDRADDPEIAYLKRKYSGEFAQAFRAALGSLDPAEQNALRHRYVEGLGIDQMAAAHGIHRASAARRVQKAEQALLADVRRRLGARLGLAPRELESVMRLIRSQLHVSFSALSAAT